MCDDLILKALQTYIDGKIKRYNLMFAVNGGIFALAKLISVDGKPNPLGSLKLIHLAIGAIGFTFVLWFDIWLWGSMMRTKYLESTGSFSWVGKTILSLLASLLIIGWLLAVLPWHRVVGFFFLLVSLGAVALYLHWYFLDSKARPKSEPDPSHTRSTPNA